MVGGAWPFVVRGLVCQVYSDNERDSDLLNSVWIIFLSRRLLRGTSGVQPHEVEQ